MIVFRDHQQNSPTLQVSAYRSFHSAVFKAIYCTAHSNQTHKNLEKIHKKYETKNRKKTGHS